MLAGLLKKLLPSQDADQLTRARLDAWNTWLTPLSGENGVGRDPGYEDAFFEVKDEAGKLSNIDDALIVRACEQLSATTTPYKAPNRARARRFPQARRCRHAVR